MNHFNFGETTYENLPSIFWKKQNPLAFEIPQVISFNEKLANELGISKEVKNNPTLLTGGQMGDTIAMSPQLLTMAYAGYQFGNFVMLGDGRAALLGEHITPAGERYDIQLKGSGRTPFSREGDGYAAIMPMLREMLISEYLAAVDIPTSRSLAVATTGQKVYRETLLTGAVLTRVAKSHLRVGTFDYAGTYGEPSDVKALSDYAINRHYPLLQTIENAHERYLTFLKEVILAQAKLIAKWQQIGFVHGVMNTDNMTISGESIDFGPCAFLDDYNPNAVFSSIDRNGRYAFKNQSSIAIWNLSRLAEALLPLLDDNQDHAIAKAQQELTHFSKLFNDQWLTGMRAKLGLFNYDQGDTQLVKDLLSLMEKNKLDYTNTYIELQQGSGEIFETDTAKAWLDQWQTRLNEQDRKAVLVRMAQHNPMVIPRNHLVEEALQAADKGDMSPFNHLLKALQNPYEPRASYMKPAPPAFHCVTYCGT